VLLEPESKGRVYGSLTSGFFEESKNWACLPWSVVVFKIQKNQTPNCWLVLFQFFHETFFCWFLEIFQTPNTRRGSLILWIFKTPLPEEVLWFCEFSKHHYQKRLFDSVNFQNTITRRGSSILWILKTPLPEEVLWFCEFSKHHYQKRFFDSVNFQNTITRRGSLILRFSE
jgi:hypothetical protein